MTPAEIELAARRRYNAVGDSNWTTAEMLHLMDSACQILAREALCIERVYTATTTASQQEYDFPTSTIAIKRVEFDGAKLQPITQREDDQLTLNNSATTDSGTPQYYWTWNEVIYLRPIPATADTLKIYSYNEPQALSSTSTLEVPTMFHPGIVDYLLMEMYAKDKDFQASEYYQARWEKTIERAIAWRHKKKRGDMFATVQDEDALATTMLGVV